MPHVTFTPLSGFRVREPELAKLGMSLPGLKDRAKAIAELPALGVLNLAGMTPESWTCSYTPVAKCDELAVDRILAEEPDLVVISALTASIDEAYSLADRLRSRGVPVVMGGLHVSSCPDEASQHADAIVVGRGEFVWGELMEDAAARSLKPRYEADRVAAPAWPMPRFDLLGAEPPRFTLQTQTGCPFSCGFCGASRLLGRFHEKPVENIRRELDVIRTLSSSHRPMIELADDNTFAGGRDVNSLFDAFEEANARWFTEADWRIGERPEILSRLADAGCVQVLVGIESLVFRYPGMGEKQAELDRIMAAVHAIQSAGVAVNGCFIVGAEGETRESMDRLVEFALNSSLAEIQITLQTPFPGTALYRQLKAAGRLLDRGWSAYTLFDVTYQPDSMTVEELELGFRDVLTNVFSADASQRRKNIRKQIMRREFVA